MNISMICPDDAHLHLRDGVLLQQVLPDTARQFARAVIMPNLNPPIMTTAAALDYRERILNALHAWNPRAQFEPLMTLYLHDETSAAEILQAKQAGIVAVKYYPHLATTHAEYGVKAIENCSSVLEMMQKVDMPLLVHGEVTNPEIDIFAREKVFIERVLQPLRVTYPALKIVFEHITTQEAVQYVQEQNDGKMAATITVHHLLFNRNAMFTGGLQPHYYCLPVLKAEKHRQALWQAVASKDQRFFLGTDSAPHLQSQKEKAGACAGCYSAHNAMELYAAAFEHYGCLDCLEGFASFYAADFYGLTRNAETLTLKRRTHTIPVVLDGPAGKIIPLCAGEEINWQFQRCFTQA